MSLHELKPNAGSVHKKKRKARGIGSGKGKTAGRGGKGQAKRNNISPAFEGGQTPLHRRLPVKKGFRNPTQVNYIVVNLNDLEERFDAGAEVTLDALVEKGLIRNNRENVKCLAQGELSKKLSVKVHKASKAAQAAIEKAGGSFEAIGVEGKTPVQRKEEKAAARAKSEAESK